jgi:phage N-6-adenine-methyltransferase
MITDTWLTPPEIIKDLGPFDLDPCTPEIMPWKTAKRRYTKQDDGLNQEWCGRVWLNPPYSREVVKWLEKLAAHGNGIALVFARTETDWFFKTVWEKADALLFLKGRIHFHTADGYRAKGNAGAPSVLIAYGEYNVAALEYSTIPGRFIEL